MAHATKIQFSEKEIQQIETMAGLGQPMDQIAAILDVSKDTIERRMKDDPRVAKAVQKGRAKTSSMVRQTAYQMAVSGEHVAMTIFWLKVREHWTEPKALDDFADVKPIRVSYSRTEPIEITNAQSQNTIDVEPIKNTGAKLDGKGKD